MPSNRIPSLDGWRGVAILLVLFDHIQWQWNQRYAHPWSHTGQHGVTLFFVLSGYLITSNLLKAENLKTFYVRRFFRLMPVAWLYLLFITALGYAYPLSAVSPREMSSCLLFYRNYFISEGMLSPAHFWSLSIEEQFYIFWPVLLIFLPRKYIYWILGAIIIACEVLRLGFWNYYSRPIYTYHTEVKAGALCVGCLLALALSTPKIADSIKPALRRLYWPAMATFVVCMLTFKWYMPAVELVAVGVLIGAAVLYPNAAMTKAIAFPPLAWVGRISYSIYVWQAFFFIHFNAHTDLVLNIAMPIFAIAIYYLIERPCTALGRSITSRARGELATATP